MSRLLLIGAGGHGRVAADIAEAAGWTEIAFLDDGWPGRNETGGWPVIGDIDFEGPGVRFVSLGDNAARERLTPQGADPPVVAHPAAWVSRRAGLGAGTLVVAGAVVNAGAQIGRGAILNTACSVDHDCLLEDFVHVSPGARLAGNVQVGRRSWIGIGAAVRQGIRIGGDALVGAGAVVVTDVPDGATVVGNPARSVAAPC